MFPERLKQLRKEKGLTQIDLAKALEVSSGTVAMWETGKRKPQFDTLEKMCDFFDRRLDYILGTSDDPAPYKLSDEDIEVLGKWIVQEEYEDVLRSYALLDDYGQRAVNAVLRTEFVRCQEQGTMKNAAGISVSVKIRDVKE